MINKTLWIHNIPHGENFMAIFTTLSVVIWFSTDTLGIFATLVYVFSMRVVIYDILSMAIITALSTSILFFICTIYYCEFHHAVWWKSPYGHSKLCDINIHEKINTLYGGFYHTVNSLHMGSLSKYVQGNLPDGLEWISRNSMGKIAKVVNRIHFTMLYGN